MKEMDHEEPDNSIGLPCPPKKNKGFCAIRMTGLGWLMYLIRFEDL